MSLNNAFNKILKQYIYKITGITQMAITEKKTGDILGSFSKFASRRNMDISGFSHTLYQLSKTQDKELDVNIFEFDSGEKLFTVSGGENVIVSAVSDKSVQMGISRMYLKKLARGIDGQYKELTKEDDPDNKDLAEIFQFIAKPR
ncbi:MAG: hypothetical protein ACFFCS_09095 [Candidatus Hodarchaeota archaeon]